MEIFCGNFDNYANYLQSVEKCKQILKLLSKSNQLWKKCTRTVIDYEQLNNYKEMNIKEIMREDDRIIADKNPNQFTQTDSSFGNQNDIGINTDDLTKKEFGMNTDKVNLNEFNDIVNKTRLYKREKKVYNLHGGVGTGSGMAIESQLSDKKQADIPEEVIPNKDHKPHSHTLNANAKEVKVSVFTVESEERKLPDTSINVFNDRNACGNDNEDDDNNKVVFENVPSNSKKKRAVIYPGSNQTLGTPINRMRDYYISQNNPAIGLNLCESGGNNDNYVISTAKPPISRNQSMKKQDNMASTKLLSNSKKSSASQIHSAKKEYQKISFEKNNPEVTIDGKCDGDVLNKPSNSINNDKKLLSKISNDSADPLKITQQIPEKNKIAELVFSGKKTKPTDQQFDIDDILDNQKESESLFLQKIVTNLQSENNMLKATLSEVRHNLIELHNTPNRTIAESLNEQL